MPAAATSRMRRLEDDGPGVRLAPRHLDAREPQPDVREREDERDDRGDRDRARPLAGLQRLEALADRLVARLAARVAALHGVAGRGALGGGPQRLALAAALTTALPHRAPPSARASRRPGRRPRRWRARRRPAARPRRAPRGGSRRRCRRWRTTGPAPSAPRAGPGRARSPGGPPSSASRGRGRRRSSRRPARRRPARGSGWRGRRSARRPTARASGTGVSSCPTWTPSAPAASTRSGRSLSTKSAPASSHSARATSRRREDLLVGRVLLAQLEHVDAVRERRREDVGERPPARAGAADEVQPGIVEIPHLPSG